MDRQIIKYFYVVDKFQECKKKVNSIIDCMQKELHLNRSLLKLVMDDEHSNEDFLAVFQGFNQSMNGTISMVDKLTEPYVEEHEAEVWMMRYAALEVYDKAKELCYEVQGRIIE